MLSNRLQLPLQDRDPWSTTGCHSHHLPQLAFPVGNSFQLPSSVTSVLQHLSYESSGSQFPEPFSSHWQRLSFWRHWIMEMQHLLAFQVGSVSDKLCCLAGVLRPRHYTHPSTALVEGSTANWFQAHSSCLQVSACSSTITYWRT